MNVNFLHYFSVLAITENYSSAANKLYVSQPSLSYAIASLERELGVPLFQHVGRGVVLTEAGKVFATQIPSFLAQYESMISATRAAALDAPKTLLIASDSLSTSARIISDFKRINQDEKVKVNFVSATSAQIFSGLLNKKYNIGITFSPAQDNNFDQIVIPGLDLVLIVHVNHPLANEHSVSLREIAPKFPFIMGQQNSFVYFQEECKKRSIFLDVAGMGVNSSSVAHMVADNMGIAVVSKIDSLSTLPLRLIPFTDFDNRTYRHILRSKKECYSDAESAFWNMVKTSYNL